MTSYLSHQRRGARPQTTPSNPHTQLEQNAPVELQELVFERGQSLGGVEVGPSQVSVPGARALYLPRCGCQSFGAFMFGKEFAHIHPPSDGSLHMTLPPEIVPQVIENGWAELHPLAGQYGLPGNIVMVYGPRDDEELQVVCDLLTASHTAATSSEA